ncbi:MAG: hypothetical protein AAGE96_22185 [Cyanobacteria bacterium P01_G01_bin.19]
MKAIALTITQPVRAIAFTYCFLGDRFKLLIHILSEKVPIVHSFSGKSLPLGKHKIGLRISEMNFLQLKSRLRFNTISL